MIKGWEQLISDTISSFREAIKEDEQGILDRSGGDVEKAYKEIDACVFGLCAHLLIENVIQASHNFVDGDKRYFFETEIEKAPKKISKMIQIMQEKAGKEIESALRES